MIFLFTEVSDKSLRFETSGIMSLKPQNCTCDLCLYDCKIMYVNVACFLIQHFLLSFILQIRAIFKENDDQLKKIQIIIQAFVLSS